MHDAVGLQQLIAEYGELHRLDGHTPQSRGRRFNETIAAMLRCWGIDAQVSVRSAGEIDVAFAVGSQRYILEAKWEKAKADTGDLAKLQRRVAQRLQGTVGLFLAMAGYSPDALGEVNRGGRLEVLLLDRWHYEAMLSGFVPPHELLKLVHDRAAFRGDAYSSLLDLLKTDSKPPIPTFRGAGDLDDNVVLHARAGISCAPLFTLTDSNQLGIAVRDAGRLLITTQSGIVEVDLHAQCSSWAVPIADCHRNALVQPDGSIMFARRYGVARFLSGNLAIVGGGFAGATCLLGKQDNSVWVLSNGDESRTIGPSLSRMGAGLGDQVNHSICYPPSRARNAAWIGERSALIVGDPNFLIIDIENREIRNLNSTRSNSMGLVTLGSNIVLTAANSVCLGITDLATGSYAEVMRLALSPSVNEIATGYDGNNLYLASYYDAGHHKRVAVLAIVIAPPVSEFTTMALAEVGP